MNIRIAETEQDIRRCWPVMQQLRPHLTEEQFVAQAMRQRESVGWVMAYIDETPPAPPLKRRGEDQAEWGEIRAVAGFRIAEYLAWGKALYVDDLIADEKTRGGGYASKLFDWMVEYAKREGCDSFHLDSGTGPTRFRAHRFYLHKGMDITSHHFAMKVK